MLSILDIRETQNHTLQQLKCFEFKRRQHQMLTKIGKQRETLIHLWWENEVHTVLRWPSLIPTPQYPCPVCPLLLKVSETCNGIWIEYRMWQKEMGQMWLNVFDYLITQYKIVALILLVSSSLAGLEEAADHLRNPT